MNEIQDYENETQEKMEFTSLLKTIFLNIFKVLFIVMIYFYLSEVFGSISIFFVNDNTFSIFFSLPLYSLVFLSVLAGPVHGFIGGFFGEFFYQISFYNVLFPNWLIIVTLIGFLSGIYKYKPLKYLEAMKIYYIFIILIFISFGIMILINLFRLLVKPTESVESIFLNFGFTFFMTSLISVIFLVPISLYIYDRLLAKQERHVYNLLLTHHPIYASDHTFYLRFGRTYIYFCSRCSGVILGAIISIFAYHILHLGFGLELTPLMAILLCIILPIPGLIDWGTQRLLNRTSNTKLRLFTGILIGIGINSMSYADEYYFIILTITTVYFVLLFIMMYLGQRKEKKEMDKKNKKFYEEDL